MTTLDCPEELGRLDVVVSCFTGVRAAIAQFADLINWSSVPLCHAATMPPMTRAPMAPRDGVAVHSLYS